MKCPQITLVFVLCYWALQSEAQHTLRFDHLTVSQGLSNHIIYDILQDRQGYLWFATDNGLNKYNGYELTIYQRKPGDTTSLAGNAVTCLHEDREGTLWVGTMGQGICRFNQHTETFSCYPNPPNSSQGAIHTMSDDDRGNLWVSTGQADLHRMNKRTGKYDSYNFGRLLKKKTVNGERVSPIISQVYCDRSGTIWLCTNNGVYYADRRSVTGKPNQIQFRGYHYDPACSYSISHNQVWEMLEDRTGAFWFCTQMGLHYFDRETGTFTRYSFNSSSVSPPTIDSHLRYLVEDKDGNLWMGTADDGLIRFDTKQKKFFRFVHDPNERSGLSSNHIRSLQIDRSGILWVGTYGDGIDKMNPLQQPFRHYYPLPSNPNSLSKKFISSIVEDRDGVIWVGTGNGLDRLNKLTGTFTHFRHDPKRPNSLPNRQVQAILEDHDGTLWVASQGDLSKFNRQTGEFITPTRNPIRYPYLGKNENIFALYEDRKGLLWLGTNNGIKSFDRRTGQVVHYVYDPHKAGGISDAWAISLLEDNWGNLWVGTGSVALNRLDRKTGQFTRYYPSRAKAGSITADAVPGLFQDSKGNMWFGTRGGGLCHFDYKTETFRAYTQADGLADNSVYAITEDHEGQIWLGTSKGLCRFTVETNTFSNYDANDGLPSAGLGQAHCKGKDGTLYFGGDNGFVAFDPRRLTTNQAVPAVVITQIKLFDKSIRNKADDKTIDLNYTENFISFDFAALDYHNPAKNQYAYQLVGLDKDWIYSGSRRYTSYTDLNPGDYIFRVKASNNDGVWNEKGASIRIIIRPPWWKTVWFRALSTIGLVVMAGMSVRFYTQTKLRRQHENIIRIIQTQETERQRLAADLHDDLGGTLATIRRRLSDIRQHLRDPQAAREIDALEPLIQKSGQDLRRIAHNLMPPEFERIGLRPALQQLVESQSAKTTRFSFVVAGTERRLPLDVELNIYRIVSELVQNIHKHARAKRAAVQMLYYDDHLSLTVEDDGVGNQEIKNEVQSMGIGLKTSSLRAEYIGAKLWREAGESGTLVVLNVPYGLAPNATAYPDSNSVD